jgi:hypothetical protein
MGVGVVGLAFLAKSLIHAERFLVMASIEFNKFLG